MIILLTNDDGYSRDGITILEEALKEKGHEIWVIAPSGNRSAQSHSMTVLTTVTITKYAENHYHCSGTPTDCILYGLNTNTFPKKPDLVISGINYGYNCSIDVTYSGTCSAAMEAVECGIPAIAVSVERDRVNKHFDFESCAEFITDNLDKLYSLTCSDAYVNINFPTNNNGLVKAGELGLIRHYDDMVEKERDCDSITYKLENLTGKAPEIVDNTLNSDYENAQNGYISISVIKIVPEIKREKQAEIGKLFK